MMKVSKEEKKGAIEISSATAVLCERLKKVCEEYIYMRQGGMHRDELEFYQNKLFAYVIVIYGDIDIATTDITIQALCRAAAQVKIDNEMCMEFKLADSPGYIQRVDELCAACKTFLALMEAK